MSKSLKQTFRKPSDAFLRSDTADTLGNLCMRCMDLPLCYFTKEFSSPPFGLHQLGAELKLSYWVLKKCEFLPCILKNSFSNYIQTRKDMNFHATNVNYLINCIQWNQRNYLEGLSVLSQHLTEWLEDGVVFIHKPPQGKDPSHSRVLGRNPAFHRWVFWSEPLAESSLTHSLLGSFPRFCPTLSEKAIVLPPASKCTTLSGLNSENSLCVSNMPQLTLIGFWFHFSPGDRRRAIFMQKNSGVKLSGNEICMLASEKETVHLPKTCE